MRPLLVGEQFTFKTRYDGLLLYEITTEEAFVKAFGRRPCTNNSNVIFLKEFEKIDDLKSRVCYSGADGPEITEGALYKCFRHV